MQGEERLGRICPKCHTEVRHTTNHALGGRPLPSPWLSATASVDNDLLTQLVTGLTKLETYDNEIVNQLLYREHYETITGIRDHTQSTKAVPLPLVTMNATSQANSYSLKANEIRRLLRHRVPQKTQMSLEALLALDTESYRLIVNSCMALSATESTVADEVFDELDQQ